MLLEIFKYNDELKIEFDKNSENNYSLSLIGKQEDETLIISMGEVFTNSVSIKIDELLEKVGDNECKWTFVLYDEKRNKYIKPKLHKNKGECVTNVIKAGEDKAAIIYINKQKNIVLEVSKNIRKLNGIYKKYIETNIEVNEYSIINNQMTLKCKMDDKDKNKDCIVYLQDIYNGNSTILEASINDDEINIKNIDLTNYSSIYYIKVLFIGEINEISYLNVNAATKEKFVGNNAVIKLINNTQIAVANKNDIKSYDKYILNKNISVSGVMSYGDKIILKLRDKLENDSSEIKNLETIVSDDNGEYSINCLLQDGDSIVINHSAIEEIALEAKYLNPEKLIISTENENYVHYVINEINIIEMCKFVCDVQTEEAGNDIRNKAEDLYKLKINDIKSDNYEVNIETDLVLNSSYNYKVCMEGKEQGKLIEIDSINKENILNIKWADIEEKIKPDNHHRGHVWLKVSSSEFIAIFKLRRVEGGWQNRYFQYLESGEYVKSFYCDKQNEIKFVNMKEQKYIKESDLFINKDCNILDYSLIGDELMIELDMQADFYENISIHIVERKSNKLFVKEMDRAEGGKIFFDCSELHKIYEERKVRFDVYIKRTHKSVNYIGKAKIYYNNASLFTRYKNGIQTTTSKGLVVVPYITKDGYLSVVIDRDLKYFNEKYKYKTKLQKVSIRHGKLNMKVKFDLLEELDYEVKGISLELRNTTKELIKYELPIEIKNNIIKVKNVNIKNFEYESFYWDFYIVLNVKLNEERNEEVRVRVKSPRRSLKKQLKNKTLKNIINYPNNYILYPYITGNNCLSLTYRVKNKYETPKYKFREFIAFYLYRIFKAHYHNKNIYLIYEKFSETAQDNSYYFFKYCREKYPEKNFYFVIDKKSKDYKRVKDDKNVVGFMSIKHLLYICAAKLFIASESKGHCYAWRVQRGRIKPYIDKKKFVFLQHGVLALKKIDNAFNKGTAGEADMFIVSSEQEREIVCDYLGYDKNEVVATGLARWDVIEDQSKALEEKEIFIMPTWRNWMTEVEEEIFTSSEYYQKYMELLNSTELQEILEKNNLKVNYFLHPKFKEHLDNFTTENSRINIIEPNTVPINELIMRASLLITDYSSVALEMFYQKKPTIFYQFDIEDYEKYQGSYIDMDKELFGYRALNLTELLEHINDYIGNGFNEREQFDEMRSNYFKYVDQNNCERIYDEIVRKMKLGNEKKVTTVIIIKRKLKRVMKKVIKKLEKSI